MNLFTRKIYTIGLTKAEFNEAIQSPRKKLKSRLAECSKDLTAIAATIKFVDKNRKCVNKRVKTFLTSLRSRVLLCLFDMTSFMADELLLPIILLASFRRFSLVTGVTATVLSRVLFCWFEMFSSKLCSFFAFLRLCVRLFRFAT